MAFRANRAKGTRPDPLSQRQRLLRRFLTAGVEGLADSEAVELLLAFAMSRTHVERPARALIRRFGTLRGVLDAPFDELRSVRGVGLAASVGLRIVRAATDLYLRQNAEEREFLGDPAALERFWRSRLGALPFEVFEVAHLDAGLRLLSNGVERLAEGTTDRAAVYPRRVVEAALRRHAAAIVVAHNHPNGCIEPTERDRLVTRALVLAGEAVDVKLLDHLVVSADEVFSFRLHGLL